MNCSLYHSLKLKQTITIKQDNDLSEFDESRDIIESLVDEYKACESPDYIKWGMEVSIHAYFRTVSFPTTNTTHLFVLLSCRIPTRFLQEREMHRGQQTQVWPSDKANKVKWNLFLVATEDALTYNFVPCVFYPSGLI